jgi:D-alanyl-D-alanine carboxypeptidase
MFRVSVGVSQGYRWVIFMLVTAVAILAITTDSADARRRYRHAGKSHPAKESYSPPTASIVVDINSGKVLHAANPDALRHPASLTKIMTLYLLFERLEAAKIKLDTAMNVSEHASTQAPTKLGLKPGETIEVEDAIKGLVTKSANDAAVVIAEAIAGNEDDFAAMMTKRAHTLGMSHTVYKNASGLPDDDQVTTAREQALLGRAIQERFPRYYKYFSIQSFQYRGNAMRNHNRLLGRVEGVDGIKTGYTNASGFNLVTSVRRGGRHLVAVVLGGKSASSRDAYMRQLIEAKIEQAAVRRTAQMVAEADEQYEAPGKPPGISVAAAEAAAVLSPQAFAKRVDTSPTIPAARPTPGSNDPLAPVLVKTVTVKAGTAHTTGLPSSPPTSGQPAPPTPAPLPKAAVMAAASEPEAAPVTPPASASPAISPEPGTPPTPASAHARGGWAIQIGAFEAEDEAKQHLDAAQTKAKTVLARADRYTERVVKGEKTYFRARFAGFDRDGAEAACKYLKRNEISCMTLKN